MAGLDGVVVEVTQGVVHLGGSVVSPDLAARAEEVARRTEGVTAVENTIAGEEALGLRLRPVLARIEARLAAFTQFLPLLVLGILVFALFWLGALFVSRRVPLFDRLSPNRFVANMWRNAVFLAIVLVGGLVAADVLGATALLGSLLGAAGLVGLAIGFAVRDTIENYIATILLSLRQPFAAMDVVEIEGALGTVARMSSRATILITADGNHLRIPNARVFKAVITNYTRNPERRLEFRVGIAPETPLAQAQAVALEALRQSEGVLLEPAPLVLVEDLADFSVILSAAAWIDQRGTDYFKARSEAMRRVKEAFDTAGIVMPVPTYALQETEDVGPTRPAAAPASTDTAAERTVVEKARAERASAGNLLSEDAAQE